MDVSDVIKNIDELSGPIDTTLLQAPIVSEAMETDETQEKPSKATPESTNTSADLLDENPL